MIPFSRLWFCFASALQDSAEQIACFLLSRFRFLVTFPFFSIVKSRAGIKYLYVRAKSKLIKIGRKDVRNNQNVK